MATSRPIPVYVATINAGSLIGISGYHTGTINVQGFEGRIAIAVQFSNVSNDPIVSAYRSVDGGATFDTVPCQRWAITAVTTGKGQVSLSLPFGIYALVVLHSGPNTGTVFMNTQQHLYFG